uniref:Uncharacterized protein n=1 Tax=Pseudo-nitzschia delicatissima TaxID=44447 RepID=A0A7S0TAA0_9STRA|mmetsp:Transcript_2371/g.5667  ORF Transcript_2371/g.5667 Transcript_2371/m.5667 type:complete len:902 (+) Transcript_2371:137-2842(+)
MATDDDSDVMAGIMDDESTDDDTYSSSGNPFMKFMPASLSPTRARGSYNLPQQPGSIEPRNEKGVDRMLMMLKYPNAREEDIEEVLKRKEIHQQALQAAAIKKGQQFREKRELEDAERWKQQKEREQLKLHGLEHEHKELQMKKGRNNIKSFMRSKKSPTQGSFDQAVSNKISPRHSLEETEDDNAVIWQAATDGTDCVDFESGLRRSSKSSSTGGGGDGGEQSQNKRRRSSFLEKTRKSIKSVFGGSSKNGDLNIRDSSTHSSSKNNFTVSPGDAASMNSSNGYDGRSFAHGHPTSEASVVTQKISNTRSPVSRERSDIDSQQAVNHVYLVSSFQEASDEPSDEENNRKSWIADKKKNKLLIIIFSLVFVVSVIVTVLAVLYGRGRRGNVEASKSSENLQPDILVDAIELFPTPSPISGTNSQGVAIPPEEDVDEGGSNMAPSAKPASVTTKPPGDATSPTLVPTAVPIERPTLIPTESSLEEPFPDWVWSEEGEEGTVLKGIPGIDEHYGQSIALSDDGQKLAIGAPDAFNGAGIVRVYERQGGSWVSVGSLLGRNYGDQFGSSVALSSDGRVLAVSEPSFDGNSGDMTGNIRTYVFSPFGYVFMGQEIEGEDASDQFGIGLALSSDGRRLAVGAPHHDNADGDTRLVSGTAKVFEWSEEDNEWLSIGNGVDGTPLIGTDDRDRFGWSVDLNDDGSLLCVGAPRNEIHGGYVQCFEVSSDGAGWRQVGETIQNIDGLVRYDDQFGASIKVSRDPSGLRHRVAIGAHGKDNDNIFNAGHVVVHEFNPEAEARGWIRLGRKVITMETPGQGFRMGFALDFHEDLLAVGIPGASDGVGKVEVFQFQKGSWEWLRNPTVFYGVALSSSFGEAISMTPSGTFAVGSPQSNDDVGSVSFYRRTIT